MKVKTQPKEMQSGDYLDQALFDKLNKKQSRWAKREVERFRELGFAIPYGIIRQRALEL